MITNAASKSNSLHWATDEHSTHNQNFVTYIWVTNARAHRILHSKLGKQLLYCTWVNATVHGSTRIASIVKKLTYQDYLSEEVVLHLDINGRHLRRRKTTRTRSERRATRAQLAEAPDREPADPRTKPFLYNIVINAATK